MDFASQKPSDIKQVFYVYIPHKEPFNLLVEKNV